MILTKSIKNTEDLALALNKFKTRMIPTEDEALALLLHKKDDKY